MPTKVLPHLDIESKAHVPLFDWHASVLTLKGVGSKIAEKLAKLNLFSQGDLLLHVPSRYEDRTTRTLIAHLIPEEWALIEGVICDCKIQKRPKKRAILTLADETGTLKLVFFHFQLSQAKQWIVGTKLRCFAQIKRYNGLQMTHPDYEILSPEVVPLEKHLTPIYPTCEGVSQNFLRRIIRHLLNQYHLDYSQKKDLFQNKLMLFTPAYSLDDALETIHFPSRNETLDSLYTKDHLAYQRLIIEELFAHHISLKRIRTKEKSTTQPLVLSAALEKTFVDNLPFALTLAQQKVWREIQNDLCKKNAMLRLVQGDVGCGKTVVAALAALTAVATGKQVAIMVPTEILAEQHFQQFEKWFTPLGYRCELLVSKLSTKFKRHVKENMTLGLANIIIGTQALFQDAIQFNELGLVIIDEQHRFGVHQRYALQQKGLLAINQCTPHQLVMTATPIPRTLMMSHYAHLDISTIDSLPPNRLPIQTLTISQAKRDQIIERMKGVCEKGQQVYWVCTLIEDSEVLTCQAAIKTAEQLQDKLSCKVGLVHGKMDALEKESIMQAFYRNEISVLVATTVIEVGVNVPNATLMVIENPERLGLAQLHQLRGRVGRGNKSSFCVLMYQAPLSFMAQARLRTLRETQDGFIIAEKDLMLRGPGELLGVRQTGAIHFKIADLLRDKKWIEKITQEEIYLDDLPANEIEVITQRWSGNKDYTQA